MPEQEENCPTPKKRSKILTVVVWMIVLLLVPTCGAWLIGRRFYWFDLLASEQMLISWVAAVCTLGVLISRRRKAFVVCVVLVCVSFWPVLNGRVWVLPNVDPAHKTEGVFRIITYNINPKNQMWREDMERLISYEADVIVLIEVNREMSRSIMRWDYLDTTPYSHWLHRAWVERETSPGFILSQWPIKHRVASEEPKIAQNHLYAQIENPNGIFIIGLMHPLSPRSNSRWIEGNTTTHSQGFAVKKLYDQYSVPMLVCADLNAGPAQYRSKILRSTGLKMSKPVLRPNGSFPSNSEIPKPLRVQLDDVWSMGNITPIAWSMIELDGSDHQAVVVDFVMNKE